MNRREAVFSNKAAYQWIAEEPMAQATTDRAPLGVWLLDVLCEAQGETSTNFDDSGLTC